MSTFQVSHDQNHYESICEQILEEKDVRFAGIINGRGRLIAGGMKSGKTSLEGSKKEEMLFMELALRVRMRREFDEELGKVKFSMSLRENILVTSFPIDDDVLLVSTNKEMNFGEFPTKVIKIIKNNSK